jgi:hypothetical protein
MAGYSQTPLWKKLGLAPGQRLAILGGPQGFRGGPGAPVKDFATDFVGSAPYDVVILFAHSRAELTRRFNEAAARLATTGSLWVAWPKKASGVVTDVSEGTAREVGLPLGLVDVKVCAIDETWSGLRFVVRRENRTPPAGGPRVAGSPRGRATKPRRPKA